MNIQARKDRALALLRANPDRSERRVIHEAGIPERSYFYWKKSDPEFREAVRTRGDKSDPFSDFLTFRNRYFGRKNFWFHEDAYRRIDAAKRLLMLVPPNHAKTMVWSIEYSAYLLMKSCWDDPDRAYRITVIQKSQDEAKKVIRAVQQRLTDHDFYERLGIPREQDPITLVENKSGPLRPGKGDIKGWGAEQFFLRGAVSGEKDPSMQAKGAGSSILGNRGNLFLLDDIQDPKNQSPHHVDELVRYIQQEVLSRPDEKGKVIALGSRIGPGDVWSRMLEEDWAQFFRENLVKYAAVRTWKKNSAGAEIPDELLCPDLWSPEGLMVKMVESGESWHSTWMQEEGQAPDASFRKDIMEAARDAAYSLGHVPPEVTHIVLGVDPALVNYAAMVVWGLDIRTGKRFLIDYLNEKGLRTREAHTAKILELARRFHPRECIIEENQTQRTFSDDPALRRELSSLGCRVSTYHTVTETGQRREHDDFSITSVADLYDNELVVLPYGDRRSKSDVDSYIRQFLQWRPGAKHLTRDLVLATTFAESRIRDFVRRTEPTGPPRQKNLPSWVAGGFPWRQKTGAKQSVVVPARRVG